MVVNKASQSFKFEGSGGLSPLLYKHFKWFSQEKNLKLKLATAKF